MSPSKRDRENARRRHERHQQQLAAQRAARTRRRQLAVAILAVLVAVVLVVVAVLALGDDDGDATASVPDPSVAEGRTWTGTITTDVGEIGIELDGAAAPQAVASFVSLAEDGYFDDTPCHRLVTGNIKVLQCGDPTGTGQGDPGYGFGPIENAPEDDLYPTGTIAMARITNDADSMGSQFFLVYEDSVIPADQAGATPFSAA
ncbi:peptidylprolyl isomerase [Cellulomonas sp. ATA003]|uniref:peptidylprolyl isomerase n=1 Tax=Cellulomonas sp. ATA003 TaxID=3073064 RepID=UPI0028731C8D|nr:peptidylprolyl isomerase [Cellulomonas sp. ATA003]WNB87353.1 peptidylprolyl isomerase [Cellulomonas sp. ATA003]